MCNFYSVTKGQSAIRDLFSVKHDRAGNMPPLPAVFPDQMAPIVRAGADGERELVMALAAILRWPRHKPRKTPIWFALSEDRPLFAFAGLWTRWRGFRGPKSAPIEGEHELFGFLTTEANAIVAPVHQKAMPVILATAAEIDLWLDAQTSDALALQRPLADDALRIVAKGEREDGPVVAAV